MAGSASPISERWSGLSTPELSPLSESGSFDPASAYLHVHTLPLQQHPAHRYRPVLQHPHPVRLPQGQIDLRTYRRMRNRKAVITCQIATPVAKAEPKTDPEAKEETEPKTEQCAKPPDCVQLPSRQSFIPDDQWYFLKYAAAKQQNISPERSLAGSALSTDSERTKVGDGRFDSNTTFDGVQEEKDGSRVYIQTRDDLNHLLFVHRLPPLTPKWFRGFCITCYRQLLIMVLLANLLTIFAMTSRLVGNPGGFTYAQAATATGANLTVGVMVRHEHYINLVFRLVCAIPGWFPLTLRAHAGKFAYNQGGIHAGCGISAFAWYVVYTALLVKQFDSTSGIDHALAAIAAATVAILFLIISLSHPWFRRNYHNLWEACHRFAGWTAVACVWAQTLIIVITNKTEPLAMTLVKTPTFWFLLVIMWFIIYPWLRLRHHSITYERLSSHSIQLFFPSKKAVPACVGIRLAHSPLVENHGFATIPNADKPNGFSVIVSRAGDWTGALIENPPKRIWSRGAPTSGVLRVSSLFTPMILAATGSGIGPVLSFLNVHAPKHPVRLIWSARSPLETYGKAIMAEVFRADPYAVVVDSKFTPGVDIVELIWAVRGDRGGEAVGIISNPMVTKKVVDAIEGRGVPAFGAIFDS